ncbi:MAG TPA: transposase [Candidatus Paceibacterota bacterium]
MGYREAVTDSFVHVYNRGVKKSEIYREQGDLFRLMYSLYFFNTAHAMPSSWVRDVTNAGGMNTFVWPEYWEPRRPLVSILAFTIMPNHFHLVLKELVEGGLSRFMHRVGMGYSKFINEKYDESGSLFQSAYKARRIEDDADIRNLMTYTMVKNPFELYPGGLANACRNFDQAYEHALAYPLSSLAEYAEHSKPAILDHALLRDIGHDSSTFKEFSRDRMLHHLEQMTIFDF